MLVTSASRSFMGLAGCLNRRPSAMIVSWAGSGIARNSVALTWVLPLTVRNQMSRRRLL